MTCWARVSGRSNPASLSIGNHCLREQTLSAQYFVQLLVAGGGQNTAADIERRLPFFAIVVPFDPRRRITVTIDIDVVVLDT